MIFFTTAVLPSKLFCSYTYLDPSDSNQMNTLDQAIWLLRQRRTTLLAAAADYHLTKYHTKSHQPASQPAGNSGHQHNLPKPNRSKKESVGEMNHFDLLAP